MLRDLNAVDAIVKCEGLVQSRQIEVVGGDSVLFAMLSGLLEQTIRCRSLDVANTFRETFVAKVYQLIKRPSSQQSADALIKDLFDQAVEGRLTLDQAREALLDIRSTDVMQALFIQDNPKKTWLIERLNDGIPVGRDDEVIIPWFCKTFGIEICIYWLESHSEYERIEFLSPRTGMIVNIYQKQTEIDIETGLLYFTNNDQEVLEPRYPNCCLPALLTKEVVHCSQENYPRRRSDGALSRVIRKEPAICSSAEEVAKQRISATASVPPSVHQTSSLHGLSATGVRSNLDPGPIRPSTGKDIPTAAKAREPPQLVPRRPIEVAKQGPASAVQTAMIGKSSLAIKTQSGPPGLPVKASPLPGKPLIDPPSVKHVGPQPPALQSSSSLQLPLQSAIHSASEEASQSVKIQRVHLISKQTTETASVVVRPATVKQIPIASVQPSERTPMPMKVQSLPPVAESQASVINPSNGNPLLEATPSLPKDLQPPSILTGAKRPAPKAINRITDQTTLKQSLGGSLQAPPQQFTPEVHTVPSSRPRPPPTRVVPDKRSEVPRGPPILQAHGPQPAARATSVVKKIDVCNKCHKDFPAFSADLDCSEGCKVCGPCLVEHGLPDETCPVCKRRSFSDNELKIIRTIKASLA
jgi:hypothetical protein